MARNKERVKAYNRAYSQKNREKLNAAARKRHAENPKVKEAKKEHDARYYAANKELVNAKSRNSRLNKYDEMFNWPSGTTKRIYLATTTCDLCGERFGDTQGLLRAVDHNHTTNKFRGIIHSKCNTGLGLLGDSEDRLLQAATYLVASVNKSDAVANVYKHRPSDIESFRKQLEAA